MRNRDSGCSLSEMRIGGVKGKNKRDPCAPNIGWILMLGEATFLAFQTQFCPLWSQFTWKAVLEFLLPGPLTALPPGSNSSRGVLGY